MRRVSVDVEDDQHRFGVDIEHNGGKVLAMHGRPLRTPWSTCPYAISQLQQLVDTPLMPSPFRVLRQIRLAEQCTHLIDIAALGVAAAARKLNYRQYDMSIWMKRDEYGDLRIGTIARNDGLAVQWSMHDGKGVKPVAYEGLNLRRAASWIAEMTDDLDEIESVFVMHRALFVTSALAHDLDASDVPSNRDLLVGACFTYQPERVADARRLVGASRTFSNADELLVDLENNTDSK